MSSSWLNLERFFGELTQDLLRDGSFSSVRELVGDIESYLAQRNLKPEPYRWKARGKEILRKIKRAREALAAQEEPQTQWALFVVQDASSIETMLVHCSREQPLSPGRALSAHRKALGLSDRSSTIACSKLPHFLFPRSLPLQANGLVFGGRGLFSPLGSRQGRLPG
jgi:hypothetical protein